MEHLKIQEAVDFFGSQLKLARAIEMDQSTISRWLICSRLPTIESALKVEKATDGMVSAKSIIEENFRIFFLREKEKNTLGMMPKL